MCGADLQWHDYNIIKKNWARKCALQSEIARNIYKSLDSSTEAPCPPGVLPWYFNGKWKFYPKIQTICIVNAHKNPGYWTFMGAICVKFCSLQLWSEAMDVALYQCRLHSQRHTLLNLTHWGLIRRNHFRLCSHSLITFVVREVLRQSPLSLPLFGFFLPFHLLFFFLGEKGGKTRRQTGGKWQQSGQEGEGGW